MPAPSLPEELLEVVFRFSADEDTGFFAIQNQACARSHLICFALVCRCWSRIALPILYEQVVFTTRKQASQWLTSNLSQKYHTRCLNVIQRDAWAGYWGVDESDIAADEMDWEREDDGGSCMEWAVSNREALIPLLERCSGLEELCIVGRGSKAFTLDSSVLQCASLKGLTKLRLQGVHVHDNFSNFSFSLKHLSLKYVSFRDHEDENGGESGGEEVCLKKILVASRQTLRTLELDNTVHEATLAWLSSDVSPGLIRLCIGLDDPSNLMYYDPFFRRLTCRLKFFELASDIPALFTHVSSLFVFPSLMYEGVECMSKVPFSTAKTIDRLNGRRYGRMWGSNYEKSPRMESDNEDKIERAFDVEYQPILFFMGSGFA